MTDEYYKAFNKSIIPEIRSVLIDTYGEKEGSRLYAQSGQQLLYLISGADNRGNKSIRLHMTKNILPLVACYQVLQENGIPKEKACALVVHQMHTHAHQAARLMKKISRLPFLYPVFRTLCRNVMKKSYPDIGWDVNWLRDNKGGIAFDCRACVYRDTTAKLGCPELCQYFCQNDDIMYSALSPNVQFIRTQTLATGGDRCDFCFLNGKTLKK